MTFSSSSDTRDRLLPWKTLITLVILLSLWIVLDHLKVTDTVTLSQEILSFSIQEMLPSKTNKYYAFKTSGIIHRSKWTAKVIYNINRSNSVAYRMMCRMWPVASRSRISVAFRMILVCRICISIEYRMKLKGSRTYELCKWKLILW